MTDKTDDGIIKFKKQKRKSIDEPTINYNQLVRDAHIGVVRNALEIARDKPLVGYYNFYITFNTEHPDVDAPKWIHRDYGSDLTIVLNNQYTDIEVEQDYFAVTIYFKSKPASMIIPYGALIAFNDKNQDFVIGFGNGVIPNINTDKDADETTESEDVDDKKSADVISLDLFKSKIDKKDI